MDFRQLETFIEVADLRSFSKAAEKLYISQPAVTGQMQKLEEELNACLFERAPGGCSLTPAGRIFYKYAKELINIRSFAAYQVNQHKNKINGQLGIAATPFIMQYLLPRQLNGFLDLYPAVSFELQTGDGQAVAELVAKGRASLGLTDTKVKAEGLDFLPLCREEYLLAVPKDLGAALGVGQQAKQEEGKRADDVAELPLSDLKKLPLCVYDEVTALGEAIAAKLADKGVYLNQLKIVARQTDEIACLGLLRDCKLCALLPQSVCRQEAEGLAFYRLPDLKLCRQIYLLSPKDRQLSAVARNFKSYLRRDV